MNIFILDEDPKTAANYYCDKHVPKMVVELYQQLGSALRRYGATDSQMPLTQSGRPLKGGYKHHPCTVWCGDSIYNWRWAWKHAITLCEEYLSRYNKIHFCYDGIWKMANIKGDLYERFPSIERTPFAQAMPDEYKQENAVEAYRNYYIYEKKRFAKWEKGTPAPSWWKLT